LMAAILKKNWKLHFDLKWHFECHRRPFKVKKLKLCFDFNIFSQCHFVLFFETELFLTALAY
jgi:hypothetical protein